MTTALRQIVVGLIRADGVVAGSERYAAVEVINRFASVPYTHEDLKRDLENPGQQHDSVIRLGGLLNEHGKESVVRAVLSLAAADGKVSTSELEAIATIGRDLGMSAAHLRGVLAEGPSVDVDIPEAADPDASSI